MTNFNISTNAGHIVPNNCASICDSHYFSIEIPYAKIHGTSFVKFQEIEITPSKNFRGNLKSLGGFIKGILRGVRCTKSLRLKSTLFTSTAPLLDHSCTVLKSSILVGSLKMNTTLEYRTRVVQEGDRRCKKSTLNDLAYLTPLRIPLMNPSLMNPPTIIDTLHLRLKLL
jgi:hypothetical protein